MVKEIINNIQTLCHRLRGTGETINYRYQLLIFIILSLHDLVSSLHNNERQINV